MMIIDELDVITPIVSELVNDCDEHDTLSNKFIGDETVIAGIHRWTINDYFGQL